MNVGGDPQDKFQFMVFGSSPKDSNLQPLAPLGSAPAPRAPRVLPPLSAPLPLTPAPPGTLCSQCLFLALEVWRLDVALLQGAV
jgi:hypothetical protein